MAAASRMNQVRLNRSEIKDGGITAADYNTMAAMCRKDRVRLEMDSISYSS
jgi:hypothetical protein